MKQYTFRFLIFLLTALFLSGCFDDSLTFQVQFAEVSGLKQDAPVIFERNEIGQVTKVTYTSKGDYLVELQITPDFKNAATEQSRFYIEPLPDNMAEMAVIVEQTTPGGTVLSKGVTVPGTVRPGYLDKFFGDVKKKTEEAENELNRTIKDLKESLNKTSESLDKNLESAMEELSLQLDNYAAEIERIPDSEEVQQVEESIRQFVEEFQKAQQDVQDHIREEILPRFKEELEHFRNQLEQDGREEDLEKIDNEVQKLEMV